MTSPVSTAMTRERASSHRGRGFLLLEMVLALAVFSMVTTGFVVALHRMSQAASQARDELRVTRILESALNETLSLPVLEPGEMSDVAGDGKIDILAVVEPIEDLQNEEGETLNEMMRIRISARWYEAGDWQEREIETWRYTRLYQP